MTKYEMIYESLQSQLDQGLITMEFAEDVNDLAYEKYVMEAEDWKKKLKDIRPTLPTEHEAKEAEAIKKREDTFRDRYIRAAVHTASRKEAYEKDKAKKDAIKNNVKNGLRQSKNAFIPHKSLQPDDGSKAKKEEIKKQIKGMNKDLKKTRTAKENMKYSMNSAAKKVGNKFKKKPEYKGF